MFAKAKKQRHDDYPTPQYLFEELDKEFHFNDDPCPIGGIFGLNREWGKSTYVNPPYSKCRPWIEKAIEESRRGKTVVMLLKGDTSTNWFHDLILGKAEVRFIRGRIRFIDKHAPFASIIVIFRPDTEPGPPKIAPG